MEYSFKNIGPFKISYTLLKWCNKAKEGTKNGKCALLSKFSHIYKCDMLILMMIIEYLYVLLYFTLQVRFGCCRSFNQFVSGITLCLQHKGLRISRFFTHQRTLSSMLHSFINLQLI